jgi:hypothetical protein
MSKDKVCKSSFWADFKLPLVGRIDLEPQASCRKENIQLDSNRKSNIRKKTIINIPARTKEPTHEMNPLRNELKGKVPTKQQ